LWSLIVLYPPFLKAEFNGVSSGAIVKAENGVRKGKVAEHWANTVKVLQRSTIS
jgi:hypothetical protein